MAKNLGFRGWFYFRTGWSTYFAFIFAAINTLTVTYYLAIEQAPILRVRRNDGQSSQKEILTKLGFKNLFTWEIIDIKN